MLWGGLLMALAFVVAASFIGPVVRPVAVLLGGVGFGLFVDEIGKFVTADYDYFWAPTAALDLPRSSSASACSRTSLQRRHPRDPAELLAAAADQAVAGLAGGFSARERTRARVVPVPRGRRARLPTRSRALLDSVEHDAVRAAGPHRRARRSGSCGRPARLVRARWVPWVAVGRAGARRPR